MKIFLSLGMSGREEKDVLNDIAEATSYIQSIYPEAEIVNTYFQEEAPKDVGLTYYLGRSIQILGSCDQVWFINDWDNYHGCCVEHKVCDLYGIPYSYLDLRPDIAEPSESSETDQIKVKAEAENESSFSERCLASDLFDIYKPSIMASRDAIESTKRTVSEFKDLYPAAQMLLDVTENALDVGISTIDHLINIIKSERK